MRTKMSRIRISDTKLIIVQDAGPSQQQHLAVTNSLHKEQHENLVIPFLSFDQSEVYEKLRQMPVILNSFQISYSLLMSHFYLGKWP
jgi:hypothetical protein